MKEEKLRQGWPPSLHGLVSQLPSAWSRARRDHFLRAFTEALDYSVVIDEEEFPLPDPVGPFVSAQSTLVCVFCDAEVVVVGDVPCEFKDGAWSHTACREVHEARQADVEAAMFAAEAEALAAQTMCPHGRVSWRSCPHCLGINRMVDPSMELELGPNGGPVLEDGTPMERQYGEGPMVLVTPEELAAAPVTDLGRSKPSWEYGAALAGRKPGGRWKGGPVKCRWCEKRCATPGHVQTHERRSHPVEWEESLGSPVVRESPDLHPGAEGAAPEPVSVQPELNVLEVTPQPPVEADETDMTIEEFDQAMAEAEPVEVTVHPPDVKTRVTPPEKMVFVVRGSSRGGKGKGTFTSDLKSEAEAHQRKYGGALTEEKPPPPAKWVDSGIRATVPDTEEKRRKASDAAWGVYD